MPNSASSQRRRVAAHRGARRQRFRRLVKSREQPVRRDLRQRPHDEQSLRRPRMRQGGRPNLHLAAIRDQVEIEGARCVYGFPLRAEAPELALYLVKQGQQSAWAQARLDKAHGVAILLLARIRPGRRSPERGSPDQLYSVLLQPLQRSRCGDFHGLIFEVHIAAERDDDRLVQIPFSQTFSSDHSLKADFR